MHKSSLFVVALAFPLTALAFDYTAHVPYSDVRPNSKEAAAINMFTNLSAVQGYGLGIFGPTRLVNRAEFMKMALATAPAELTEGLDMRYWDYTDCFPDVRKADWFNIYVCYGKLHNIVKGNPDGLYHPERTVNNAEALKIFTLIYGYDIGDAPGQSWMVPYYNAAAERGVDLPIRITFETPLTRAQVMRLAGAFRAEHEGKLEEYRLAENGIYPDETSSSSSASSESSVSSSASSVSSSVTSSSSSSVAASLYTLPSTSHFLIAGVVSDAIGDGVVRINGENGHIRAVEVKLFQEVLALDTLKVYTASGVEVMTLRQRTNVDTPDYKQIYQGQLNVGQDFAIPGDTNIRLVIRADVRGLNNNGASNQLLQMRTFNVTIQGDTTNTSYNQPIPAPPFPAHQTAFGRMVSVSPLGPATATLVSGSSAVVAAFSLKGAPIDTRTLYVENLIFAVSKSDNVQTGLWRLTSADGAMSIDCTMGSDGISCLNIPADMGRIIAQGTVLQLRTHVQVAPSATNAFLQAELPLTGSANEIGSVQWHDEAGHFRWVEKGVITGKGTRWQK
jgi:S-layer homology domain